MMISILNQKGGVGKTTLAVHLATALAMKDKRVMLIDADPQASALLKLRKGRANSITFPVLEAICDLWECQPGDLIIKVPDPKKGKR